MESRSEKDLAARDTLPTELRSDYDRFVEDYKFAATVRHGSPYVSYIVLADMIKAGWRRSAEPVDESRSS